MNFHHICTPVAIGGVCLSKRGPESDDRPRGRRRRRGWEEVGHDPGCTRRGPVEDRAQRPPDDPTLELPVRGLESAGRDGEKKEEEVDSQ